MLMGKVCYRTSRNCPQILCYSISLKLLLIIKIRMSELYMIYNNNNCNSLELSLVIVTNQNWNLRVLISQLLTLIWTLQIPVLSLSSQRPYLSPKKLMVKESKHLAQDHRHLTQEMIPTQLHLSKATLITSSEISRSASTKKSLKQPPLIPIFLLRQLTT